MTTKKKTSKKKSKKQRKPKAAAAKATKNHAKQMSLIEHAAAVLAKAKAPMNARDLAEKAIANGWKTKGAAPAATLYAAMLRDARFERAGKGVWRLAKKAGKRGAA